MPSNTRKPDTAEIRTFLEHLAAEPWLSNSAKYNFVETAELGNDIVSLKFSPDTRAAGPFDLKVRVVDHGTGQEYRYDQGDFYCPKEAWRVSMGDEPGSYRFSLTLDDHLAYRSDHFSDLPF